MLIGFFEQDRERQEKEALRAELAESERQRLEREAEVALEREEKEALRAELARQVSEREVEQDRERQEKEALRAELAESERQRLENDAYQSQIAELRSELDRGLATLDATHKALDLVFPMNLYIANSPDLQCLEGLDYLNHFIEHGQYEKRLATYSELDVSCREACAERDIACQRLSLLGQQIDQSAAQLEFLKDIISRLAQKS